MTARPKNARTVLRSDVQGKDHSYEFYRALFDEASDGIVLMNVEGRYLEVNPRLSEMLGYTREEMLGFTIRDLVPAEDLAREPVPVAEARQGERVMRERLMRCKDGTCLPVEVSVGMLPDGDLLGFMRDISHRRTTEEALRLSQAALENAPEAIYWIGQDAEVSYVNATACAMLGYTKNELMAMSVFDFDPCFSRAEWDEHWALTRDREIHTTETTHRKRDGTLIPMEIAINFLRFRGKEYHCTYARDITERKKSEIALQEYQSLLATSQQVARLGTFRYEPGSGSWLTSGILDDILGVEATSGMDNAGWLSLIHPEDRERVRNAWRSGIVDRAEAFECEFRIVRKADEKIRWVYVRAEVQASGGTAPPRVIGTVQDIHERRMMDEELKRSLHEKDILLREVHHRVKNNLQIISSLLHMQARGVHNTDLCVKLRESQNRVRTMAIIHEALYRSSDFSSVELDKQLAALIRDLEISLGRPGVKVTCDLEPVSVGVDIAIPIGLIVNELVTNAFKHAFPQEGAGNLGVAMRKKGTALIAMDIRDNGRGFPAGQNFREMASMGMTLLDALSTQLGARVAIDVSRGTAFSLEIPLSRPG